MKRKFVNIGLILTVLIMSIIILSVASTTLAAQDDLGPFAQYKGDSDDIPSPLSERQRALRQEALQQIAQGNLVATGPVVEVAHGQFVELARDNEDLIWTVLGEFGNLESPFGILQGGAVGPQHNQIPQPDRAVDNSTIWTPGMRRYA